MLAPISPSAAQTRNNAALDSTRANSQAARNQPESTDSATDASAALEEQPPSTAEQSGPEAAQPDNTAATLTVSQAQGIIADSLDKIAAGEIAPFEPEDFSVIDETDAAAAADAIGRLLARDGASADLAAPLSIIAAARAGLIERGISDENLASFDKALETLVIQRFLSATGNPNADPVLLSESRDTLQLSNFITTTDEDAFIIATLAIAVANTGIQTVEPDETVDLSGASPNELGSAAADAADRLGRLAGEFRFNDIYDETQTELATIRAQLQANGASPLQLNAFDNAVATISRARAFEVIGSPFFDVDALREARAMLTSGELEALSNPTPEFEQELASTVSQLISSAISAPIDTVLATEIAALTDEEILFRLDDLTSNIAEEASDLLFFNLDEEVDQLENNASEEYATIRAQLKADGASEQQLADLDDFVTQSTIQKARENLEIPLTESESIIAARIRASSTVRQEDTRPAAISRTELLREARLDDNSVLTEAELGSIQEALVITLQFEASTEFSSGNLSLANFGELTNLLSEAADAIAQALETNDDVQFQRGVELFDQVRDEIFRRTPANILPSIFINAFERRIADAQSALKAPGPEADARLASSSDAILNSLTDLALDEPFGIASQNSFEGDNGAEPVNIFVVELKPAQGSNDTAQFAGHDVVVTNVIERQLQEAGQSYELTTIQTGATGSATADALVSVAEMAEQLEGPTYLNLSISQEITSVDIALAFTALRGTDLVPDELLSTPISQDNFDLFANTVRSIALAANDPERTDVAEALGRTLSDWQRAGEAIQAMETAAAAGIDVFVATPNSSRDFSAFLFVNDDGLAGSITRVAATTPSNVFTSNDFILPEQGEDFPEDDTASNGIALEDSAGNFYRGTGVDAYAGGVTEAGLNESLIFGSSFASPEMLVNAVLGRFDPSTETRFNGDMAA